MQNTMAFRKTVGLPNFVLALCVVVLFHLAALWAVQSGLLLRAVQIIVPAEILSEFIEPPIPKITPPPPPPLTPPPPPPKQVQQPLMEKNPPVLPPPLQSMAIADATPSPNAPAGVITPQPAAPPIAAPVAEAPVAPLPPLLPPAPALPAPPAPAKVELPSSDADYLQNPKPSYPPMSKRLGEQGKVLIRALIGVDGIAQKAEIKQSSGFERLDQAALTTVLRWRYTPGKRAGVAEAMWFNVPINFVLE